MYALFTLKHTLDLIYSTVCMYHGLAWSAGHVVLCPPLEDLDVMIKFEEDDWKRRVKADVAVGDCPRRVPPLNVCSA